ncbi:TetR/AcrR family transcriptional regulator [Aureimonas altamirensis]|uniref:TetR/AcrR family transcriptional regulator n=1 Tax=Aureimonas altamirensis TaxID=370622 RepID=UPI002555D804|nr:TetR/AcrR family transcriptional regulator [Aureimonas altamirensis]
MARDENTYHHGDLKGAVLAEARTLLEEGGVASVSMREIAKRTGVTHRAIYRWYADRDALLVALAAEGFRGLSASIRAHLDRDAEGEAKDRFVRGYLEYAVANSEIYRLAMAQSRTSLKDSADLKAAVDELIALSVGTLDARSDGGRDLVMAVWAALHGLHDLYRGGLLAIRDDDALIAYARTLTQKIR